MFVYFCKCAYEAWPFYTLLLNGDVFLTAGAAIIYYYCTYPLLSPTALEFTLPLVGYYTLVCVNSRCLSRSAIWCVLLTPRAVEDLAPMWDRGFCPWRVAIFACLGAAAKCL